MKLDRDKDTWSAQFAERWLSYSLILAFGAVMMMAAPTLFEGNAAMQMTNRRRGSGFIRRRGKGRWNECANLMMGVWSLNSGDQEATTA